jgi:hypothetical protein
LQGHLLDTSNSIKESTLDENSFIKITEVDVSKDRGIVKSPTFVRADRLFSLKRTSRVIEYEGREPFTVEYTRIWSIEGRFAGDYDETPEEILKLIK